MALPLLVEAADLEAWLGVTFDPDATLRAEAVLAAVSAIIRSETSRTWVAADGVTLEEVPDEVRAVVLQVATRTYNNPRGARQQTSGPFSVSYGPETGLFLTASERALLARFRTNARGLWSLSVTRDDPYADTVWVPVEGAEYPFPWYGNDVIV